MGHVPTPVALASEVCSQMKSITRRFSTNINSLLSSFPFFPKIEFLAVVHRMTGPTESFLNVSVRPLSYLGVFPYLQNVTSRESQ